MKKIVAASACFLIISCKESTQDRISKSVKDIESQKLSTETIESLSIDSINYDMVDPRFYWLDKQIEFNKNNERLAELSGEIFHDVSQQKRDSLMMDAKEHSEKIVARGKKLDSLYKNADTSNKIYKIDYVLNAKTSERSISEKKTLYLVAKDYSEFNPIKEQK